MPRRSRPPLPTPRRRDDDQLRRSLQRRPGRSGLQRVLRTLLADPGTTLCPALFLRPQLLPRPRLRLLRLAPATTIAATATVDRGSSFAAGSQEVKDCILVHLADITVSAHVRFAPTAASPKCSIRERSPMVVPSHARSRRPSPPPSPSNMPPGGFAGQGNGRGHPCGDWPG
jgi:hypothetical protein